MLKKIIQDYVMYNCDNPEKMIITKEDFSKKVYLFGIKIFEWTKDTKQGFDNASGNGKMGFK